MSGVNNILYLPNNCIEMNSNNEIKISTKVGSLIDCDMIISKLECDYYILEFY